MDEIKIEEYVQKALAEIKKAPEKLAEIAKNNEVLRKILGDDGKLSKDDLDRIVAGLKETAFVKGIVGEDGKFDKDDITRLTSDAKNLGEELIGKAKDFFEKK